MSQSVSGFPNFYFESVFQDHEVIRALVDNVKQANAQEQREKIELAVARLASLTRAEPYFVKHCVTACDGDIDRALVLLEQKLLEVGEIISHFSPRRMGTAMIERYMTVLNLDKVAVIALLTEQLQPGYMPPRLPPMVDSDCEYE